MQVQVLLDALLERRPVQEREEVVYIREVKVDELREQVRRREVLVRRVLVLDIRSQPLRCRGRKGCMRQPPLTIREDAVDELPHWVQAPVLLPPTQQRVVCLGVNRLRELDPGVFLLEVHRRLDEEQAARLAVVAH